MRLTIALTTALALAIPYSAAAEQATQGFRIMDQAEAAKYREKLENLQGEARDKYRNQVYAQLRQRAWDHGYEMPAKPPWWGKTQAGDETFRPPEAQPIDDQGPAAAQSEAAQSEAKQPPAPQSAAETETETEAPDMPKQIAQQKQVIEEAAEAESQPDTAGLPAGEASNTPTANAYREQMRRRFDDFMARREERQRQLEEKQRARWQRSMPPNTGRPMQPQGPAMPPSAPVRPPYPQPAQPQPMQPGPGYPMPQQPAYPGYPPYGYPPPAHPAPGWY